MTVAGVTGVVAGLMVRSALYVRFGRGNNAAAAAAMQVAFLLVGAIVYALSFLLIRVLSRYRELAADRAAAYLTGAPSTLASALTKLTGDMSKVPTDDLRAESGASHLALVPAVNGTTVKQIFSTHPSLEKRLAQLNEIAAQLSRPN